MTTPGVLGVAVLVLGFGVAIAILAPLAMRWRLGILHPAVAWLALEGVFFGVGSLALALGEDRPGPAAYLGACVAAMALGALLAARVGRFAMAGAPLPAMPAPLSPSTETGLRRIVPGVLAAAAVALLVPTLLDVGLPLISSDATVSRSALVGVPVQFIRVAIPALGAVLLLEILGRRPAFGSTAASWVSIVVLLAFMLSLASRYLVLELAAGLVLAWLLTGRAIPVATVALAASVGLGAFVVIGVLRAPADYLPGPGGIAAQRTISRLFLVQPRTLDALQAAIPAEQPYFLGLTWLRRAGPFFGRDDIPNLGYWVYPKVVDAPQAVAGYAAPGLIGEAWANLGPAGIGLFLPVGAGLELLAAWVATHRSRAVDVVAASLAILFVARTHALGLLGVTLLLVLVACWRLLAGARVHKEEVPVGAVA